MFDLDAKLQNRDNNDMTNSTAIAYPNRRNEVGKNELVNLKGNPNPNPNRLAG